MTFCFAKNTNSSLNPDITVQQLKDMEVAKQEHLVEGATMVSLADLVTTKCNRQSTIEAMSDLVFGEANGLPESQRFDIVRFVVSEAIKNNRSICEEKVAKAGSKPTSTYRYTSVYTVESKKQKWGKSYLQQVEWVKSIMNTKFEIVPYDHFITVDLAKKNPPSWFKFHIKEFNITGAHVFVSLDFKSKQLEGYNKMKKLM